MVSGGYLSHHLQVASVAALFLSVNYRPESNWLADQHAIEGTHRNSGPNPSNSASALSPAPRASPTTAHCDIQPNAAHHSHGLHQVVISYSKCPHCDGRGYLDGGSAQTRASFFPRLGESDAVTIPWRKRPSRSIKMKSMRAVTFVKTRRATALVFRRERIRAPSSSVCVAPRSGSFAC